MVMVMKLFVAYWSEKDNKVKNTTEYTFESIDEEVIEQIEKRISNMYEDNGACSIINWKVL